MSDNKNQPKIKKSERRMAENEVVFRNLNEQVEKDFDEIAKISKAVGEKEYPKQDNDPLHFFCECYDENCDDRIIMKPSKYSEVHEQRDRFIILPSHNAVEIESIVYKGEDYWIVDKNFPIDQNRTTLQDTPKSVS